MAKPAYGIIVVFLLLAVPELMFLPPIIEESAPDFLTEGPVEGFVPVS
jgi:hypothetical protein